METVAQKKLIEKMTPEAQNAVKTIAEALRPVLDEIHSKPETTKNYYGDYMAILSRKPRAKKLIAISMLYAGCNPDGLLAATKLV
jgi:hypothetical protein